MANATMHAQTDIALFITQCMHVIITYPFLSKDLEVSLALIC